MDKRVVKYIVTVVFLLSGALFAMGQSGQPGQSEPSKSSTQSKKKVKIEPSYAWTIDETLGSRTPVEIDTSFVNYHLHAVPTQHSLAWATTGNYGAAGQDQIFFNRKYGSDFFFEDVLSPWLHSTGKHVFYNTRIPMTLVSHTTGGDKYSNQDRTMVEFSGNANKRLQIGASMDYIYSKGSYDRQSDKNFNWNLGMSYLGDRYELHAFYNHYAFTTQENGGITDDLYITDPAEVQGGETSVDNQSIPVNLSAVENSLDGSHLMMNHRYKVGFYRYVRDSITDTVVSRFYVPVTSFIWTLDYKDGRHRFTNNSASDDATFFENTYLSAAGSADTTKYMQLTNTLGVALLEGFNKWAKFGLSAYAKHQYYRQTMQTAVEESSEGLSEDLTAIPATVPRKLTENRIYVGGALSKTQGSLLHYNATAEFGLAGGVEGNIKLDGEVETRFKLLGDTVSIRGYGSFHNTTPSSMMRQYVSNHYIWNNDFDKTKRFRVGGELDLPFSGTNINVGYESLTDYVYFNNDNLPTQHGDMISVLSATLKQDLAFKLLHWDNEVTYQTSSDQDVLPLPKLSWYSNVYLQFQVARVLHVQLGVDCNYYTRYYAPAYNPATMTFHTQNEMKCGDFLYMNAYANFRLKMARFFVLYTHGNGKLFGSDHYFSSPHYPLNPRRFQVGVSVDFTN